MTTAADNPIVVLFEDRPKQSMVFQLNLSIYLDANVIVAQSVDDLRDALAKPAGVQLVITRGLFRGGAVLEKIRPLLRGPHAKIPVICLGAERDTAGLVVVDDEFHVKPMIQAAAKLLGITAQQMVNKERLPIYEVSPNFFQMLFTFPCDVFEQKNMRVEKLYNRGDRVDRAKIDELVKRKRTLSIESLQRLKLANAVAEQSVKASAQLADENTSEKEKMNLLSASLDMVAAQFQTAGMDEETVKLANASIKAVEKIAESASSVGGLVKKLLDASGGYRYTHSQLITFLGFHVIKMMGWWGDDQRNTVSQVAFYHDIIFNSDDDAKVRTAEELATITAQDPKRGEFLKTHAQSAARELQTSPEISPEVVRIVIQHHGSAIGSGYSREIGGFDNLTKTFVLCEEWADYLIRIAESNEPGDNDGSIAWLKGQYKDSVSHQIIETFRYLDVNSFNMDFLEAPDLGKLIQEIKEPTAEAAAEPEIKTAKVPTGDGANKLNELFPEAEPAEEAANAPAGRPANVKPVRIAAEEKYESETTLEGVTYVRKDDPILVKDNGMEDPYGTEKKIGGVTYVRKDEAILVKEKSEARKPQEKRIAADAPETESSVRVSGDSAEKGGKKVDAATAKRAGGVDPPAKSPEPFKTETTVDGVTYVRKDEALGNEAAVVATNADEKLETEKMVNGVTYVRKDEAILIKQKREEQAKTKIGGVTDVRKDEVVVIKADNSQNLVDRSITRIKGEAEKERDLKMKTLTGTTELMRCALSGALDKVTEIATASPAELRKTDAEGRSAIHFAAMAGSVPVLKFLLEKGAAVNGLDSKRRSPLFMAALHKQNDAFDLLLASGGKANLQALGGMTIPMIGAYTGNLHVLQAAIEKGGARADSRDHSGKTALDLARQNKMTEAIAYLEKATAPKVDPKKVPKAPTPAAA